jgi:hypothetical protein
MGSTKNPAETGAADHMGGRPAGQQRYSLEKLERSKICKFNDPRRFGASGQAHKPPHLSAPAGGNGPEYHAARPRCLVHCQSICWQVKDVVQLQR